MYINSVDTACIFERIQSATPSDSDVVCLFFSEHQLPDFEGLIAEANRQGVHLMGGFFPAIVHGREYHQQGCVISVLPAITPPLLFKGLDGRSQELEQLNAFDYLDYQASTLLFVDGQAPNIGAFLRDVYDRLGQRLSYFGGGAGSLSLRQRPCVFSNAGIFKNAAVMVGLKANSSLGVRHGWKRLAGPFVATKTSKNVVEELNWENAFEVYKNTVEPTGTAPITSNNFFDIAKGFPFGMMHEGHEDIVRDPISVSADGHLVCVGEVAENSVLHILQGDGDSLIASAARAAQDSVLSLDEKQASHLLVADCISRVLFLEERFSEELDAALAQLQGSSPQLEGILSLGEIASYGDGSLQFFNKTFVINSLDRIL